MFLWDVTFFVIYLMTVISDCMALNDRMFSEY